MGRVAKYKKIKACDPFSKRGAKNRNNLDPNSGLLSDSRKRRGSRYEKLVRKRLKRGQRVDDDCFDFGFDRPVQEKDDFDLSDPSLTVTASTTATEKKEEESGGGRQRVEVFGDLREEARAARLLKLDSRSTSTSQKVGGGAAAAKKGRGATTAAGGKKEGESLRAYRTRTRDETRLLMKGVVEEERKEISGTNNDGAMSKQEKRREFLKQKKLKKKKNRVAHANRNEGNDNDDDDDGFVTGEKAKALTVARTALGDQVERPPTFAVIPRGAKRRVVGGADSGGGVMDDAKRVAEQKAMEIMRRRAQEQYAILKQKRRKNGGDFHL